MAYFLSHSKLHFMEDAFAFRRVAYARNTGNDFQTVDLCIFKENVLIHVKKRQMNMHFNLK